MVEFSSKIICGSSNRPLKSEILTFLRFTETFRRVIRGKF
jgi:hypothetical protein